MLLQKHVSYTDKILAGIRISKKVKAQVLKGVTANDLCEFTNEGQPFFPGKDSIRVLLDEKKKLFGGIAIYQSHFGKLASMHAMSVKHGEPAVTTLKALRSWFDFLNGLALGSIRIKPNTNIGSDKTPIDGLFAGLHIKYEQLFDSKDISEIRYRSVGMMLHLIQDSFTQSHCKRDENMDIIMFYYYKDQDKHRHENADDASASYKKIMTSECSNCATSILLDMKPYDCMNILKLGAKPQNSGGGEYSRGARRK